MYLFLLGVAVIFVCVCESVHWLYCVGYSLLGI